MIRYLTNEEIDSRKWDVCIKESMPSLIYVYSWYLDVVCDHWGALVQDDYEVVMPIPYTTRFGIKLAIQPPFTQQLGVFSRVGLDENTVDAFLEAIPKEFRWVKLNLNFRNRTGESQILRANYVLDLIADYETLSNHYASDLMRGIKSSQKSSCSILEGIDPASMLDLITYQNKTKGMGISMKSMERLSNLIQVGTAKGVLISIGMYSPMNHLCSVAIFLRDNERVYYLIGASDEVGREYRGMARILDNVIRKFSGQGITLDFEGSEIPGVADFFKRFGARLSPYPIFVRKGMGILNPYLSKRLGE